MAIKIIDRKIKSYRGFKTLQLKYLDTTTGKTWFSGVEQPAHIKKYLDLPPKIRMNTPLNKIL